jgi:hypothetical protein
MVTLQLVLDLYVTHTICGVGTEPMSDGLLYRDTVMAGCRMHRRHGCNHKVNVMNFFLRVTMWSSYRLLENMPMSPLTSAQMDFWSRFRGRDQVRLAGYLPDILCVFEIALLATIEGNNC